MALGTSFEQLPPSEYWLRVKSGFVRRYPSLAPAVTSSKSSKPINRLVGTVNGRGWEVSFFGGKGFSPEPILGLTTAVRLVSADRSLEEPMPWYYAGPRPRVFSRNYLDYDRIIMRYRRREGEMRGALTGDSEFDRRWAIYPHDPVLGDVLRDREYRQFFVAAASAGPRRAESPTIAILGSSAVLSVSVDLRSDRVATLPPLLEKFSAFLDQLETLRGQPPASRIPIPVDYLPDETDTPYPVPRIHCPACGAESHPRYMERVDTEVCDKCRKSLYLLRTRR